MAALKGTLPLRNIHLSPFWRNYSDQDGRTFSPEQNKKIILATGVISPPSALPNAAFLTDARIGLASGNRTRLSAGRRNEVLPITNNPALNQRNNIRGEGNTGRWKMLGKSPKDGMGIGFDYWERLLIDPSVVDLGNVVSETVFNVVIRNTFRRDNKSITSIDNNAGAGITLSGATPPANLAPLANKVYVLTVSTQGPPNIDGTIDFITNVSTLSLTLTGTRIIIFPYPPQRGISENMEWLTDVIRSADGTEQRHSLRANPRQSVVYDIVVDDLSDINNIRNLFADWTTRIFGVPVWWYEQALRADVATNDTTIYLRPGAFDNSDFRVGGLAMVYQEDENGIRTIDTLEIATIVGSVASPESTQDSITFATAIQNNYDGNIATVVPVIPGILADGAQQNTPQAGDSSKYSVDFEFLDNENLLLPGVKNTWYNELDDFEGRPTLIIEDVNFIPNGGLSEKFEQIAQRIDFDTGKFQQLTQELKARRNTPFIWNIENASFEWQIRSLLYYLKGKLRNAWIPTWRKDFIVNTNVGNGANSIDVENHGYARYINGQTPWAGLRILKTDGSYSYHRITGAVEIDSITERMNIDPVTAFAATVAEVERVDLMILARQNTDSIKMTHNWMDAESDAVDTEVITGFVGDVQ